MIPYCKLFAIRKYIMFEALLAAAIVALLSLSGVFVFGNKGHLKGSHRFIIPIAIGMFLGVIFFELIPETLHGSEFYGAVAILVGFLSFYVLSHYLRTYHHHHDHTDATDTHAHASGARMLLIGDAVHNIADGVVIASAFLIHPGVGIAATIGIALHEIPQEIAEYGVLRAAGYSRNRALFLNFLSASSILVGVLASFFIASFGEYIWILTGIAAGNLLYIVTSDLIPELQHHTHKDHFMKTFISTLIGLVLITVLISYAHEMIPHDESAHDEEIHAEEELHLDEEEEENHEGELSPTAL